MLRASPHRGEDIEVRAAGAVALGVVDVHVGSQSAVTVEDGELAAFVGRLDNHDELAAELRRRGHEPREPTTASALLAAFACYGDDAPRALRGEYTAAVADGTSLRCFRDHLGLRALFHRRDQTGFYVASEPKQVVAGAGIRYQPDRDVVEQIFYGRPADETAVAIDGVSRLPKATLLDARVDAVRTARYWWPESLIETQRPSLAEIRERFDELMDQAAARMVTPATVVSLSGGIDSPAIAAYAAPRYLSLTGRPLPALSRLYPDHPAVDEREYIELVATELGLPLTTYTHTSRHVDDLQRWMRLLDSPVPFWSGSDIEVHLLEAHRLGADTVLTGEVAELVVDLAEHPDSSLLARGRVSAYRQRVKARRARGQSPALIARRTLSPFLPRPLAVALAKRRLVSHPRRIPEWIDRDRANALRGHLSVRGGQRWRWNQLRAFEGAGLSVEGEEVRQDVLGARVRMPWGDIDLWEFFLSLPAEVKYPSLEHKPLVRQLLRGRVPDPILDRSDKTVFNDAVLADIDYAALRAGLLDGGAEVPGVDYHRLAQALREENLDVAGYVWARDLCVVHAFLSMWSGSGEPSRASSGGRSS